MTAGKLTVGADGKLRGPARITYNDPFPCVNGNYNTGGAGKRGVLMHTMVCDLPVCVKIFNDRSHQASAQFGIAQDGQIWQFGPIGKNWDAWHAAGANATWYGIEHADHGNPDNPLTDAQMTASAQVVECLSAFAGFPLQVTDSPARSGFGTHVMGGTAWSPTRHTCPDSSLPGQPGPHTRSKQRAAIIAEAKQIRAGTGGGGAAVALTKYPDISGYQAGISLRGAPAVCCKATQGPGFTSSAFAAQVAQGRQLGILVMAYHFLEAGDPAGQAAHARAVAGDLPLMVDFEPTTGSSPTLGDCTGFIDAYRAAGGVTYLCYFPHWYWVQRGSPDLKALRDRGMVLVSSSYPSGGYSDDGVGWAAYGGMTPQVWQYSSSTPFGGQRVDFNAFKGSVDQLRSLATTGTITAAPPPPALEDEDMPSRALPTVVGGTETLSWTTGTAKGYRIVTDTDGDVEFAIQEYHTDPSPRWVDKGKLATKDGAWIRVNFAGPDDCTALMVTLTKGQGTSSVHTIPA